MGEGKEPPKPLYQREGIFIAGVAIIFLIVIGVLLFANGFSFNKRSDTDVRPDVGASSRIPVPVPDATKKTISTKELSPVKNPDKWFYTSTTDVMTSKLTKVAMVASENSVSFSSPYQGPQKARLILRDSPRGGRDVMLVIERGQLLCHSYLADCKVGVRFDEGKLEHWSGAEPADNSTTTIFIRGSERFIRKLRSAKVLRIAVIAYQEGEQTFEFTVSGFDYARFQKG